MHKAKILVTRASGRTGAAVVERLRLQQWPMRKLLSGADMAGILQKVVGHVVLPVRLPFWMFSKATRMTGVAIHEVCSYRDYLKDHRGGAFSPGGGVTDVVARLTGQPAEDFETKARRYAAMPFARPTVANRLAAIARLGLLPFHPAHDLSRYERQMRFPRPPQPTLSSSDERWRAARREREFAGSAAAAQFLPTALSSPAAPSSSAALSSRSAAPSPAALSSPAASGFAEPGGTAEFA